MTFGEGVFVGVLIAFALVTIFCMGVDAGKNMDKK